MNNFNTTACAAQAAQCNATVQHTVAEVVDGVVPERVTEIIVEEEEEEEGRIGNLRALTTTGTSRVLLKYKMTVYDPLLTFDMLSTQLKAKVVSKEMDGHFQVFARHFNMAGLGNSTFAEPRVTHLNPSSTEKDSNSDDTGLIVGVTVGGAVILLLFIFLCFFGWRRKNAAAVAIEN